MQEDYFTEAVFKSDLHNAIRSYSHDDDDDGGYDCRLTRRRLNE